MRTLRWSRWGLLSMCCAAGAFAAEGDNATELFDKLDANKDGQVSSEEVPEEQRPHLERLLRKGDKDENKSLSKEEWEAAHKPEAEPEIGGPPGKEGRPNPGQMFERMDANKDGKLQKSEIPEGAPPKIRELLDKAFEKAGKDELSREDLLASMGKMAKDKSGGPGGKGDPGKMIERLKKLDKNSDGKVTTDEFPTEGAERLQGLLSKIGGGESIDIGKAEEYVERQAAKQAAKMEKKGPGEYGGKKKKRPGEEGGPIDEVGRPEGGPPEGDRPPHLADRGDGPGPGDRGPGERGPGGPGEHGHRGHGPRGGVMALLDENHDGRLSRDEFARAATYFGDLDKNHDGAIDSHELMGGPGHGGDGPRGPGGPEGPRGERGSGPPPGAFGPDGEHKRDGDRPRPEGPDGERDRPGFGGPRPEGGPAGPGSPRGPFDPEEFFKRMDKDSDGAISKEEAPGRMQEHFDDIDSDKDGKLSKDELKAHREKRMSGRGSRPGPDGPGGPRPERPAGEEDKSAEEKTTEEKPAEEKPAEEAPKA